MTNRAQVLIHGKRNIHRSAASAWTSSWSMWARMMIRVGDEVILLGDGIQAYDLAEWTGTNEYEVLTNISARVPSVYKVE
jgi:alanine racemase